MQSFTRTSFCNERRGEGYISNEVLEFFGDSVLSAAIITILLDEKTERYEHGIKTALTEGDFSNIRSKLADKRNLSKSTYSLGLQKYLIMGEGDSKLGIANEPSVMEDLFESIVGAVYIDCGKDLKTVIKVVAGMLDTSVYLAESAPPMQSAKNSLQEFCADKKRRLPPPVYKTASETGPDHRKTFERAVYIGDRLVATGKGKNQKEADSAAAATALAILKAEAVKSSTTAPGVEVLTKLKEFAAKNKQPSPEFRDLGEAPTSTKEPEFMVECRLMGKSATGTGKSKQDARIAAADKLLRELNPQPKTGKKKLLISKKQENKPKITLPQNRPTATADKSEEAKVKQPPKKAGVSHSTTAKRHFLGKGAAKQKKRS